MQLALGLIETKGLVGAIEAADAMLKAANVKLVSKEKITAAMVTIKIVGEVAAVRAAVDAGAAAAQRVGQLLTAHVIPRPDDQLEPYINNLNNQPAPAAKRGRKKNVSNAPTFFETSEENDVSEIEEEEQFSFFDDDGEAAAELFEDVKTENNNSFEKEEQIVIPETDNFELELEQEISDSENDNFNTSEEKTESVDSELKEDEKTDEDIPLADEVIESDFIDDAPVTKAEEIIVGKIEVTNTNEDLEIISENFEIVEKSELSADVVKPFESLSALETSSEEDEYFENDFESDTEDEILNEQNFASDDENVFNNDFEQKLEDETYSSLSEDIIAKTEYIEPIEQMDLTAEKEIESENSIPEQISTEAENLDIVIDPEIIENIDEKNTEIIFEQPEITESVQEENSILDNQELSAIDDSSEELEINSSEDLPKSGSKSEIFIPVQEELEKMNVHDLRHLARSISTFPIKGRQISKANRPQLIEYFNTIR